MIIVGRQTQRFVPVAKCPVSGTIRPLLATISDDCPGDKGLQVMLILVLYFAHDVTVKGSCIQRQLHSISNWDDFAKALRELMHVPCCRGNWPLPLSDRLVGLGA